MIAVRLHDDKGGVILLLVLEPGNLEKLKAGEPIHKFLNEFMPELKTKVELIFAYTPDIEWVAKRAEGAIEELAEIISESLSRPPVIRDSRSAEEMRKGTV